jgi:hypothetical protein
VIEGGGDLGFSLKTAQGLRVCGDLIKRKLEGHETPELSVLSLAHYDPPATAKLLNDAVVRDRLADQSVGSRACWERTLVGTAGKSIRSRALSLPCCPSRALNSLQLRVLRPSSLKDGDVGVGVFPEDEEVLVGAFGFCCIS